METALARIAVKCNLVRRPLQPLPVVVGPSTDLIDTSYVVVDDIRYKVESPLEAVDVCFKLYHALHASYPCQSSYTWLFLQKAVYNLDTPWDAEAPNVEAKVSYFKQIK